MTKFHRSRNTALWTPYHHCHTRTVFRPVALILPTRSQELMVPDIQNKSNKQNTRLLFCSDLSINKNHHQNGFNWCKKEWWESVKTLVYRKWKCLIKTTQMILGVKGKSKCSNCTQCCGIYSTWHRKPKFTKAWQRHLSQCTNYYSFKANKKMFYYYYQKRLTTLRNIKQNHF